MTKIKRFLAMLLIITATTYFSTPVMAANSDYAVCPANTTTIIKLGSESTMKLVLKAKYVTTCSGGDSGAVNITVYNGALKDLGSFVMGPNDTGSKSYAIPGGGPYYFHVTPQLTKASVNVSISITN